MGGKNRIKSGAGKKTCRNDHALKANNESYKGSILVEENQIEQERSAQNQPYNVVISNVSLARVINGKLIENKYMDEKDEKDEKDKKNHIFKCHMTNEAPIKSLMFRLNEQGQKLNKIILIESDKVKNDEAEYEDDEGEQKKTHVDILKEQLDKYATETHLDSPLEYEEVEIQNEPTEIQTFETVLKIYNLLSAYRREVKGDLNIYIESNGGVRYVLTMLLSLTQTLERCYENVHIVEITSMVFGEQKEPIRIKNTKAVYDSSQIVSIVDEFINYGRCKALQTYVDTHMQGLAPQQQKRIQSVLNSVVKTTEDIQLCRTTMMLDDFYGTGGVIKKLRNISEIKKNITDNMLIFRYLFQILLNEFEDELYENTTDGEEKDGEKNNIVYLPNMIKWCLDKSFTLQALTLCSEKTAEYLFAAGLIKLPEGNECLLENDNKNYEKHYYFLSNLKRNVYDKILPAKINAVLRKMKDTSDQNNTFFQETDWDDMFIMDENDQPDHATCSADMEDCSKEVWVIVKELIKRKDPTDTGIIFENKDLENIFNDSIFGKEALGAQVEYKSGKFISIKNILNGQNLTQTTPFRDCLKLIIPKLVEIGLQRKWDDALKDANTRFNKIVDAIFSESEAVFKDSVKERYNSHANENSQPLQSEKYYILDAIQTGFFESKDPERLQEILYVYSICKEQRNLSSHANVSQENEAVAMNSKQLHRVIERLLGLFTGAIEPVTCKSEN